MSWVVAYCGNQEEYQSSKGTLFFCKDYLGPYDATSVLDFAFSDEFYICSEVGVK